MSRRRRAFARSIGLTLCFLAALVSFAAAAELSDNRPLAIRRVALDRKEVAQFARVELTADIAARYANPFDPEEISVEAEIRQPGGAAVRVPGFYYTPMRLETGQGSQGSQGHERMSAAGPAGFRVRYTPVATGKHTLVLCVRDRSGAAASEPIEFTATPGSSGNSGGFVRVGPSSRYFALDDGRPFFCVGENLCWAQPWRRSFTPMADYETWIAKLGAAGGNWARLWLAYNEKGLEWMPQPTPKPGAGSFLGLGKYAQDNAWRLDRIVDMAGAGGVRLMFCIGTYGEFTEGGFFNEGCWISNPYNATNGGPCAKPAEFWTNPKARKLYQQRLRYMVARWGYAPEVFAWEFWNEVPANRDVNAWVAEMAAYLKRIDPNRHMVSTTYGDAETWRCPDVDFTMSHMYGQAGNVADFTPQIHAECRNHLRFGKPYLLAEFGIDWQTGDDRWDPAGTGRNMHNGAWAAMFSGAAGTSMLWYWDGYVHPRDLYRVFTPVRKFADTIDWTRQRLSPIERIEVQQAPGQPETFSDLVVPGVLEWGKTPSNQYRAGRDGVISGGPIAMTIASPHRGNPGELFTQLVWEVDMPQAGKVVVKLGQVCTAGRLQIAVDDKRVVDRPLETGPPGKGPWKNSRRLEQWKVWVSDYDEDIAVEVPAGRHRLTLSNATGDWLQIRSITLPAYRSSRYPHLNALGLQSDTLRLAWLHNPQSTWRADFEKKPPKPVESLRVSLPAPTGSRWHVQWWDTTNGKVTHTEQAQAADGRLTLTPAPFAHDIAIRAEKIVP